MDRSRIPGFYKYSVSERLRVLYEREMLSDADYHALLGSTHLLTAEAADHLVENVLGVFSLPMGLGLNFLINDKAYVVPLVVEEPSIIAAVSLAAKLVRESGGFESHADEAILIGQVQVVGVPHIARAQHAIIERKEEILNLANSLHPRLVARGGGARDIEAAIHPSVSRREDMLVVHLLVDTCDAMGANLVNSMCEEVAPLIEEITGGQVFLRILSNLCDRSLVHTRAVISPDLLKGKGYSGEEIRDGIVLANDFALADPYRAATHNKGILNGVDAVAIATGNDWRAIEAAAHAYAARGSHYASLTRWYCDEQENLVGELDMPIKVGTVGGSLQSNPTVQIAHRLLRIGSARELMEVMGAVGLAQNFAALRALVSTGIQSGHMALHARSVAVTAGAPPEVFDRVVEELIKSREIKVWKAQEILEELTGEPPVEDVLPDHQPRESFVAGHGKVILLGEHAVVYGHHALAAPVPLAIQARVSDADEAGVHFIIPTWGVEERVTIGDQSNVLHRSLDVLLTGMGLADRNMLIEVYPHVPRAMGLGGSAALAVAVIRALDQHYRLGLSEERINALAFLSEKVAHGSPSGIDNSLATYGKPMLFRKGEPPIIREVHSPEPIPVVLGLSGVESLTARMVAQVQTARDRNPALYDRIFEEINSLTLQGTEALEKGDLATLGELMNVCHGLLGSLQVSTWELEELVGLARKNGAIGAKLTGGGGGGSIIALCPGCTKEVADAIRKAGYRAIISEIG